MKLSIQSTETMWTLTIEVSDYTYLDDLKILIANEHSPAVTRDSIRLYRKCEDELLDPSSTLHDLGVTSGDTIFFFVASTYSYAAIPILNPQMFKDDPLPLPLPLPLGLASGDLLFFSLASTAPSAPADAAIPTPNPAPPAIDSGAPPPTDAMDESVGTLDPKSRHPEVDILTDFLPYLEAYVPVDVETRLYLENALWSLRRHSGDLLKLVMDAEGGEAMGVVGRLVIAVHAVFLDSGFVVSRVGGRYGFALPKGWAWGPVAFSIPYTFPDLAAQNDAKVVILKFSAMGKYVSVDGFVRAMREREEDPPHSLRLETVDVLREREEKDVFKLWRTVKDGLALPLLIDFCDKNGLPLPPCFRRLPAELKIKILEFLPGVDVARAACTDSELKYLSSNDELWKQKFVKEFGLLDEREPGLIGCGWRDKFAKCWTKAKDAKKRARLKKLYPYGIPPMA